MGVTHLLCRMRKRLKAFQMPLPKRLATNLFLSGFTTDPDDVLIRNNGDAAITLILSSQCKGLIA